MFKRTLCALMALLCILGTLPMAAFSTEGEFVDIQPAEEMVIFEDPTEETEETEFVETEPVETEPVETEAVETEPVETEPVETDPVETEPVETEPVETEPVETEPVETEPVETEPVETEPVETEPVETEPVETEPIETEPIETEPVIEEPVEVNPIVIEEAAEEAAAAGEEEYVIAGEYSALQTASNIYGYDSTYFKYWYDADYGMEESEKNNSRSTADYLPVSSSTHIYTTGTVKKKSDEKDYYTFTISSPMQLKLLCLHPYAKKNYVSYTLYDSDGDKLKSASKIETWTDDSNAKFRASYLSYALEPGTYYIRAAVSGNAYWRYEMVVNLYPRLGKTTVYSYNNSSTGKPVIYWNSISGAQKYEVYRATSKKGKYSLKASVSGTSWTDTAASAGKKYYYKVKAVSTSSTYSESGYAGSLSSYKAITCKCATPVLTAPSTYVSKPYIDWEKISGAKEYKVYYSTDGYTWKKLATTSKTAYTHKKAKYGTYYYKVKAISKKSSSGNSAYSNIISFTSW